MINVPGCPGTELRLCSEYRSRATLQAQQTLDVASASHDHLLRRVARRFPGCAGESAKPQPFAVYGGVSATCQARAARLAWDPWSSC